MALTELIGFAVGALRGHRLRTVLSVAGVAVGIAAVIALTALGDTAEHLGELPVGEAGLDPHLLEDAVGQAQHPA
ncbi:MAG TPA: ABC transporter permease, partial [Candidatus Sulfomarinibacteraceae bacterium]|nr:ABC transporter permease [Candidatus Sulfomarinibacteraceae bacterium]